MQKNRSNRHSAFEQLEDRLMFVTYQVDGTAAADTISISIDSPNNRIISVVNGVSDSASDLLNNNILISGLGGNDTITIVETGDNTVVVNAGDGNDTINFALGTNDLDNIDDNVTVNGDAGADSVTLNDQNDNSAGDYFFLNGNQFARTNMPNATLNVDSVTLEGNTVGTDMIVSDPPTFGLALHGNGATSGTDGIQLQGAAGETALYIPSGTNNSSGSIASFGAAGLTFNTIEGLTAIAFTTVTLKTPHPDDSLSITSGNTVSGSSGGVQIAPLKFDQIGTMVVDTGTNDGGAGNDTIAYTFNGTIVEAQAFGFNVGTGTNTLSINNNLTIDTDLGAASGTNLTVKVNGGVTTFTGFQNLNRLEINNGSTAQFTGTGIILNAKELAVVSGTGNLNAATNQTASILNTGTFSVGAGRTFVKKGAGTLQVFASQSNGNGSAIDVQNGTMLFNSDCGSISSRPLSLTCTAGVVNFGNTQHLTALSVGTGFVNLFAGFAKVIFTNSVDMSGEGGGINLTDNDMAIDYTAAADDVNARALLHTGRANGAWNGIGINSASAAAAVPKITTLGSMEATEFKSIYGAAATFRGETIDNTTLLIKYTYYGDADFNGKVDGADYALLDAKFNQQGTSGNIAGFINGDFDDNGKIDGSDYALIDAAFNGQGGALRPAASPPDVGTVDRVLQQRRV